MFPLLNEPILCGNQRIDFLNVPHRLNGRLVMRGGLLQNSIRPLLAFCLPASSAVFRA